MSLGLVRVALHMSDVRVALQKTSDDPQDHVDHLMSDVRVALHSEVKVTYEAGVSGKKPETFRGIILV